MKRLLRGFLHYGMLAAVRVWADAVGLMASHLTASRWRWAFVALSIGGRHPWRHVLDTLVSGQVGRIADQGT